MEQPRTKRTVGGRAKTLSGWTLALGVSLGLSITAQAQFHAKTPTGETVVARPNPTVAAASNPNGGPNPNGAPVAYRGAAQNAAFIDTGAVEGARLGYSDFRNAVVWGRAIFHPDDSYTESKQDAGTNSLTQETKSAGGVLLQRRLISLDAKGRPSEILIYDGRGEYKYRGQVLYDNLGRFQEEQIYDTNGQLLRNRIQKYDASGKAERLIVVDDKNKIPGDLKLVITREDGIDAEAAQRNLEEFQNAAKERKKDDKKPESNPDDGAKKPGLLKRFFGKG